MRITFIGPVPPLQGGIAHHSSRMIGALRSLGHEVEVVSWRAQYPRLLYRGAQKDEKAPPFPGARFILRWWSVVSWWRARRIARGSDLLIFPYVTPFLAIPQWFMALGSRQVAAVVHNALPHERMPLERPLAKLALGKAGLLIAHGQAVADDIRNLGISSEIDVVPMPPILEIGPSPMPGRPPLKLLFFGYVRPYKGLGIAIESIAFLIESGVEARLTVVGDFWDPVEDYQAQIDSLGLHDHVHIKAGYVTDDDLRRELAEHHIVVAPYIEDSLSGVIPVALAAGRPVVSTLVRGVSEQVDEGISGVLVPPRDPAAFAQGVKRAAEDLAALARGAAESAPTWESIALAVTKAFH
jgi:glycosyltransferase involved in cell wall biosynthesis